MKHHHLPHIDLPHHYQFVTFRTFDSTDNFLLKLYAQNKPSPEKQVAVDTYLDSSNQGAYLNGEALLQLSQFLCQKDGKLYKLICFAIMPNHVHMLFKPLQSLSVVMQKIKGGSARLLNKTMNRTGSFWTKDYFDKLVRDEKHFQTVYRYIQQNPMKLKENSATKVAHPKGSEAQGERRSLRKHPGVLASPRQEGHNATKVTSPKGSEALASPIEQDCSATLVAPPNGSERFYGIYE